MLKEKEFKQGWWWLIYNSLKLPSPYMKRIKIFSFSTWKLWPFKKLCIYLMKLAKWNYEKCLYRNSVPVRISVGTKRHSRHPESLLTELWMKRKWLHSALGLVTMEQPPNHSPEGEEDGKQRQWLDYRIVQERLPWEKQWHSIKIHSQFKATSEGGNQGWTPWPHSASCQSTLLTEPK